MLSAAAICNSFASAAAAPVTSMALTSWWAASGAAISAVRPDSRFTTPPGRSEVASTSPSDSAGSGHVSLVTTTAVLPVAITGARTETRPRKEDS